MTQWTLFLDESGNTGTNLLDKDQRFYVYAGWLIRDDNKDKVCEYINSSFNNVKSKELKSVNILKRYRPNLYKFILNSIENDMIPFYYVAEKKYYICCKITETFFDYAHNSNVSIDITNDFELKKEISDIFYANEKLLELFSKLISNSTISIDEMRAIKQLIAEALEQSNKKSYKNMISNINDEDLLKMIEEYEIISENDGKLRQSPGATILFSLIYEVEKMMEKINGNAEIIVDELSNKTFINDIKLYIDRGSIFNRITSLEIKKSDESVIIQAADLLAGYINAIYKEDARVINDIETKQLIMMFVDFDEHNKKYGFCPLMHMSYEK